MVDLMYLRHIWQSKIISSDYDYEKYGGRVTAKLKKSLQKSQIGTFFTNFLKDIMNEISWISLLLILLLIVISGWVTL